LKSTKKQTKTAELLRCGFNVINRIIHISVERGLSRGPKEYELEQHINIDEKSFKKGQKTEFYFFHSFIFKGYF